MPRKPKKRLNARQAKFIKELTKGKTQTDAAIAAGYSKNSPGQAANQVLEQIRKTMPEALEEAGLGDRAVIEKYLLPMLNAEETKFFAHEGKVRDKRKVKAWTPRQNALDMLFKIKGSYVKPPEAPLTPQTNIGVKVVLVNIPRPKRPNTNGDAPSIEVKSTNGNGNTNGHKP